jgi:hypothetical protein
MFGLFKAVIGGKKNSFGKYEHKCVTVSERIRKHNKYFKGAANFKIF